MRYLLLQRYHVHMWTQRRTSRVVITPVVDALRYIIKSLPAARGDKDTATVARSHKKKMCFDPRSPRLAAEQDSVSELPNEVQMQQALASCIPFRMPSRAPYMHRHDRRRRVSVQGQLQPVPLPVRTRRPCSGARFQSVVRLVPE